MHRRPLLVTIVGCVLIAAGAIGFFYHLGEFRTAGAFPSMVWVELVRLMAVLAGAFVLRGRSWARWLAIAWIGFHVVLSAFHTIPELAVHCLFFAVITYVLVRPDAARYFGRAASGLNS